ncbi:MAG TPA: hypothetical protein VLE74_03380 [Candidatus Saccharimonadales bacterium]|nr:hypothetical protein [Candidatus Saccharimonadales bacterium]
MDDTPQPNSDNQPQPEQPPQPLPAEQYNPVPIPPPPAPSSTFSPAVPPQPVAAPVGPAPAHHNTNAGLIVLQWLTYAFWGWTVLGVSILVATVLASFITGTPTGDFTPYGLAAVLVLLPIAVVCDIFYSKQEPPKKTGPASLVMIIHAVLFALFAIGSLIAVVFSLVSLFTSSSDSSGAQVALYSAMIITVLYAAVFLRTLHPRRTPWISRFFPIFMVVVVGIIAILGITGPMAKARLTRNDKLIENNIGTIQTSISSYTNKNKRLPTDLGSLKLSGDAQKVIDKKLVTYKPESSTATVLPVGNTLNSRLATTYQPPTTYYYQLCATYKKASDSRYNSYRSTATDSGGYSTYVTTYDHPAGETCYKLKTDSFSY